MNGFFSRRDEAMGRVAGSKVRPTIDEHCPLLSEALQGRWDEEDECIAGQPYTLSLWQEGSYIKFCLGAGDFYDKFFGSFQGLDAGMESIERCLREGKGDWRAAKCKAKG
jgi:hypothetical protein